MYIFFLQEKCRDFEENSWFDTMLFYGFRHDEIIESVDDDIKLLPTVVEKIIQPRLTGKINNSLSVTDEIVSSVCCRLCVNMVLEDLDEENMNKVKPLLIWTCFCVHNRRVSVYTG